LENLLNERSLQKIFFIIDKAQNLAPYEIKTIITRAGEGKNWFLPVIFIRLADPAWIFSPTASASSSKR